MKKMSIKNLALSGMFIALGLLLPFLTGQIPTIGNRLLPMHIPVLISGFVLGWPYGLMIGFIIPLLRSVIFGMPIMFPIAIAMAFELGAYGLITGLLSSLLPKKKVSTYFTLIISMIIGRGVWGIVSYFLFGLNGMPFTKEVFMAGAFINAIPGIIIQLILIPLIINRLNKSRRHYSGYYQ